VRSNQLSYATLLCNWVQKYGQMGKACLPRAVKSVLNRKQPVPNGDVNSAADYKWLPGFRDVPERN
jgi:hypothetical protein